MSRSRIFHSYKDIYAGKKVSYAQFLRSSRREGSLSCLNTGPRIPRLTRKSSPFCRPFRQGLIPRGAHLTANISLSVCWVNVRRMGRSMVLRVKDNNPIGTQKTISLDFDKEQAHEGRQGNNMITFNFQSPPLPG